MNKFFLLFLVLVLSKTSTAQSIFTTDTFSYTINLDLSKNRYLKTVPVDLLKGYCKGDWNAYYPKREMNQCLFDDFLQRFNYFQLNIPTNTAFCFQDYCNDAYYKEMYQQFTRKLKYKEIVYLDQQHSFMKREVLWVQVYYSREEYDGWKHYEGPVFWLRELKKSENGILVFNKDFRSDGWTLEKEFNHPSFIVNENKQKDDKKKIQKTLQLEEY